MKNIFIRLTIVLAYLILFPIAVIAMMALKVLFIFSYILTGNFYNSEIPMDKTQDFIDWLNYNID